MSFTGCLCTRKRLNPLQSHINISKCIRDHERIFCSCKCGTQRRRKHIDNISQVMHNPYKKCMGAKTVSRKAIVKHLREYKRGLEFKKSTMVCQLEAVNIFFSSEQCLGGQCVAYYVAFKHVGNVEIFWASRNNCCFTVYNFNYSTASKGGISQFILRPTKVGAQFWDDDPPLAMVLMSIFEAQFLYILECEMRG